MDHSHVLHYWVCPFCQQVCEWTSFFLTLVLAFTNGTKTTQDLKNVQVFPSITGILWRASDGSISLPLHCSTWKNTDCGQHSWYLYIATGFCSGWFHCSQRSVFCVFLLCTELIVLVFGLNTYIKYVFLGCWNSNFIDEEC